MRRKNLDCAIVQTSAKCRFAGLFTQDFNGFRSGKIERIVLRDVACHRKQPARRIKAARARGAHQIAQLMQGVEQVGTAAFRQIKQARQIGIGKLARSRANTSNTLRVRADAGTGVGDYFCQAFSLIA